MHDSKHQNKWDKDIKQKAMSREQRIRFMHVVMNAAILSYCFSVRQLTVSDDSVVLTYNFKLFCRRSGVLSELAEV